VYDRTHQLISQTDARGVQTGLTYDALGRLLTRKIVSPVVSDAVLSANTYDQAKAGYYNTGKLTSAVNVARTQTFAYDANGLMAAGGNGAHGVAEAHSPGGQTLYKTYTPATLAIGAAGDPWRYDALGRLISMPGMITNQTYEADGNATLHWLHQPSSQLHCL
jgi:YD repeat-containing protein